MALETYSKSFIGDGTQAEFDIGFESANSTNILAIVNGLIQIPQVDYTVFSSIVTFTNPPLSSSDIEIRYYTAADTGAQGPVGPAGVRGEVGYQGSLGYFGSVGYSGSRGVVGYQGSKGIDAVNILFANSDPVTNTGFRGDQTLWWNPDAQVLYIYSGGAWNAVTTVGYKGSAGDRGATGYLGSTGLTGFTGSAGVGYVGSSGTSAPRASQSIASDGSNSYTLNETVSDAVNILVSVNGLVQIPEVDYTVSGTTITFINIPNDNSDIEIKYFGPKVGATGYRGSVGYQGSVGATGYTGSVGYIGSKGSTGFTGSVGDLGASGFTGSTGFTGSIGIGYAGSMGPAGSPKEAITFIGNGVDTDFETYRNIANPAYIFVMVNGLVQLPTTDYTIKNTTQISFAIPPIDGSDIEVRLFESSGYSGSEGFQGSRGSAGYRGSVGFRGSSGVVGYQGSRGLDGNPGGDTGYTGSSGLGYTGSAGVDGAFAGVGYTGSKGELGDQGNTGYTGSRGLSGEFAAVGYTGSRGASGEKGEIGDAGEIGYTGSAGLDGAFAALGYTGSIGPSGYTGSRGAGFTGSMGPVGAPNESQTFVGNGSNQIFTLNKSLSSSKAAFVIVNGLVLIPDVDYTISGTTLTITDTPANNSDVEVRYFAETGYSGSTGSTGYRGSAGYQGSAGDTGYVGSQGYDGSLGYTGSQGLPGEYAALGFTGSRGSEGPTGYTGSIGPSGFVGSRGLSGAPKSKQLFSGDGITDTFILQESAFSTTGIFVMVNGLVLVPDVDYTVNNLNQLVLQDIPNDQSDIEVRFFGEIGYTGSTGSTGYRGSVGYRGSQGINGLAQVFIGSTAPPLEDRIDGELWWDTDNGILNIYYEAENTWVGIAEGPRGPRGFTGSVGYAGSRGFTGSLGYTGSRGDTGFTGSVGFVGSQGDIGYSGSQGIPGEAAAIGYTGSQSTVAGFTGSRGNTGFVGSTGGGFTGSKGDNGFTGSQGSQGPIGFTGSSATGGGAAANSFGQIVLVGPNITATQPSDSLEIIAGSGITLTQDVGNKQLTISASGGGGGTGYTGSQGNIGYTGSAGTGGGGGGTITVSTLAPTGGNDGDTWYRYTE